MNSLQKFEEKYTELFVDLAVNSIIKKSCEETEAELKAQLQYLMEENGITSIDNDFIRINYIAGSKKNPYVRFNVK